MAGRLTERRRVRTEVPTDDVVAEAPRGEPLAHSRSRPPASAKPSRRGRRASALGAFTVVLLAIAGVSAATFGVFSHKANSNAGAAARHKPRAGSQSHASTPSADVSPVATLSSAVSSASAVTLGSHGALFFGGLDTATTPLDTIQRFDGTAVSTTGLGTLPTALAASGAARLGDVIYVFGGTETNPTSAIVSVTQDGADASTVSELPQATANAAVAHIGETAYVIGGFNGTSDLDSIVAYSPTTGTQTVASLPIPLTNATAVAVGSAIYIIGGTDGQTPSDSIYRFKPSSKAITTIGRLPHQLQLAASADLDGKIIVVGGEEAATDSQRNVIYSISPTTGKVTVVGALPISVAGASAVGLSDEVLVGGGVEPSGQTNPEIYAIKIA